MAQLETLFNAVHHGDCLEVMADWPDAFVDLCYLELPASSQWQWDQAAAERVDRIQRTLADPGHDAVIGLHIALGDTGLMAYLAYLAERLPLLRRVLKPLGRICLNADTAASHYSKVLMDGYFSPHALRDEILWRRVAEPSEGNGSVATEARQRGTLVWYCLGDGGADDDIIWSQTPVPDQVSGARQDHPSCVEMLVERVIGSATRPGDVVLDPFSGTSPATRTASDLGRHWIGIGCGTELPAYQLKVERKYQEPPS